MYCKKRRIMITFQELGLEESLLKAVDKLGYCEPMPSRRRLYRNC